MEIMINALIGTKHTMTHVYLPDGRWIPVTRLTLGPCVVTQVKIKETDGYQAVQLGFGNKKRLSAAMAGHLKPSGVAGAVRWIREVGTEEPAPAVGNKVTVDNIFRIGDRVSVTGWTKGRGFSGVVKRWGFAGGPKTHGQSDRHRAPGSIGQGTTPGRIYKGKKMAGRSGSSRKTIKNLPVVKVDGKHHQLWVHGAVPGYTNGPVIVQVLKRAPQSPTGGEIES